MASTGDFLSNFLLGALSEGQERRKRSTDLQQRIAELVATQRVKNLLDPETRLKSEVLSGVTSGQGALGSIDRGTLIRATLGLPKTSSELAMEAFAQEQAKLAAQSADPFTQEEHRRKKLKEESETEAERLKALKEKQEILRKNRPFGFLSNLVSPPQVNVDGGQAGTLVEKRKTKSGVSYTVEP